jgi:hypothetical protein
MASPLFPNFNETQKQAQAAAAFRTRIASLAREAQSMASGGVGYRDRSRLLSQMVRQAIAGLSETTTERYAAGSRLRSLWDVMATAGMGLTGQIVEALVRPNGRAIGTPEQEAAALLNLAAELIREHGGTVSLPEWANQTQRQRTADRVARNVAETSLPEFDYRRQRQPDTPTSTPATPDRDLRSTTSRDSDMIRVESSNVYAIGYRWNDQNPSRGTLLVRFWEKDSKGKKTGPGPTYGYYDVHPQVFRAFELAASKGKFVWDRLRIRGTVTGHQFQYRLVGLGRSGYVPRQATRYGNKEYFIGRSVGAGSQRFRSSLPDRLVGSLNSRTAAHQQRSGAGLPYRGQSGSPNRGTPNRGR